MTRALFLLLLASAACETGPTNLPFGAECRSDGQCESHLCVSESRSTSKGWCTESCASSEECPNGTSCAGITRRRIAVCTKSSGVPFLDGQEKAPRRP